MFRLLVNRDAISRVYNCRRHASTEVSQESAVTRNYISIGFATSAITFVYCGYEGASKWIETREEARINLSDVLREGVTSGMDNLGFAVGIGTTWPLTFPIGVIVTLARLVEFDNPKKKNN